MAITFYPKAGTILLCDFSKGFVPPEIVKLRPVVVVSPNHRNNSELYTVVPLSKTAPKTIRPCHLKLTNNPISSEDGADSWAKCDLVMTVARTRLDRFKMARGVYRVFFVSDEELSNIRGCLKYVLGIA